MRGEGLMLRILVIDDDHDVQRMIFKMLDSADREILTASNGVEAISIFDKKPCDIVITDIIMPEKEGLSLIKEIRIKNLKTKIVAISGGGRISAYNYLKLAKKFGADRTIAKPFTSNELHSVINELG
jgi:YesN/AraC family two-component response regulator